MHLPPACSRPASIFSHSVESNISGILTFVASRDGKLVHVGDAVAADEIDVDVEDVRALFLLRFCEIDQAVPVSRHRAGRASSLSPMH